MKRKTILLYSDLEGTLLREKDGKYDEEELNEFLSQIDKLQQKTDAMVKIHLVSPIDETFMNDILFDLDKIVSNYNRTSKDPNHTYVSRVDSAAAYPMEDFIRLNPDRSLYMKRIDSRIMQLAKPMRNGEDEANPAGYGKKNYVKQMTEYLQKKDNEEVLMSIYCGNGRNDLAAMDYINSQKNGIVICPKNSRREVKEKALFVSDQEDLKGIIDGIKCINKQIEKRKAKSLEGGIQEKTEESER